MFGVIGIDVGGCVMCTNLCAIFMIIVIIILIL